MLVEINTLQYVIALCSAITGFFLALRPIRAMLAKLWRKTLGRNGVKIDSILSELRPNGGDSLRDSINRIEEKQHGFDAFLMAQLNVQDVAIFRTNAEGKCIFTNRRHQRLTGFSISEIQGDGWINVIHPDHRNDVYTKWHNAVKDGREFSEDIKYIKPNGYEYCVHVSAYRELDKKGKLRGYLGLVTPLEDCDVG